MAFDIAIFDTLIPSRFIAFTIPYPDPSLSHCHVQLLRVAVLDSPVQQSESPQVALMLVPKNREHDWIFSTESGHLQLVSNFPTISRLILMGDQPDPDLGSSIIVPKKIDAPDQKRLQESLMPLAIALSRKICFKNGNYNIPILDYEDNVLSSVVLEKCVADSVGEMLVEDVEIKNDSSSECHNREFRRRLRFKRMPNLIQTEVKVVPETCISSNSVKIGENVKFIPDISILVHVYLVPMVAGCALISSLIEERIRGGFRPKALCLGVGGGALVGFLTTLLDFEVLGVEIDEEVVRVARQYFGLEETEISRVCVGDAIEFIQKLACRVDRQYSNLLGDSLVDGSCCLDNIDDLTTKFEVIMVDLDSGDASFGITAPPLDFVTGNVLLATKLVLSESGILVVNMIPPNKSFYEIMIQEYRKVFHELYGIDVGNGENFVLIATVSPVVCSFVNGQDTFLRKLRLLISGAYIDSIRKI